MSRMIPGECIVLFQPDDLAPFEDVGDARPVRSEPVRSMLIWEARKAGAVIDFGDDPEPPDDE
jgi:hypothetical protein